jgi:uncharacterized delta-60 repeat protein
MKRNLLPFCLSIVVVLSGCSILYAQPGNIDYSFNTADIGFGNGDGPNNNVYASSMQSDGKVIISGLFSTCGITRNCIARLNPDGSLDTTFNPGTGMNNLAHSISVQSDGKIIIGGAFGSYNGTPVGYITRVNGDGTIDGTFNAGTGADGQVTATAIQSDGKIIIGGAFYNYNGTGRSFIARLKSDGSLDTSFNPGTGANFQLQSLAIQPDGKIIIAGDFTMYNGTPRYHLARINTDGSLDTSFDPVAGADNTIWAVALQSDGKVMIAGDFSLYNLTPRHRIARVNANGALDATFNPGTGPNNTVECMTIQSDGAIIIGGLFTSYTSTTTNYIARVNSNGTLDATYGNTAGANYYVFAVTLQPDGKCIMGGAFTTYEGTYRNHISRLNTDGSLDDTFIHGWGANGLPVPQFNNGPSVYATAIQSDGKILVGGFFFLFNGVKRSNIVRLNTDGSVDTTFNPGAGADNSVYAIAIQSDGKILIGGEFTFYNGVARGHIARLNSDGSLDATLNPGTGANAAIRSVSIESDETYIIGGDFTSYNGNSKQYIAHINSNGSFDGNFNSFGAGASAPVFSSVIQNDGKIIIGGQFIQYNFSNRQHIVRLFASGAIDGSFGALTLGANANVNTISLQSDSNVIIGGEFIYYNDGSHTVGAHIGRLHTDGSVDTTFNPGTGADNNVYTTAIQSDGKIIIGGVFTSYNGIPGNLIARVNSDGSLDTGFNPAAGANDTIWATAIQTDGKIIAGGKFTAYHGTGRNRITRIIDNCTAINTAVTQSSDTLTATEAGAAYQWVDCNNGYAIIPGQTAQSFIATTNGTYSVIVTESSCSDTSACFLITTVGVTDVGNEKAFSIYPDPFTDEIYISAKEIRQTEVVLYDVTGKEILREKTAAKETKMNTQRVAPGFYLLRIGAANVKLVKEK